jgi:hypothetical protein
MNRLLARRIDNLAKARIARRRTHYLFREEDETREQLDARKHAMFMSGKASPGDRFVIVSWVGGGDDPAFPRT